MARSGERKKEGGEKEKSMEGNPNKEERGVRTRGMDKRTREEEEVDSARMEVTAPMAMTTEEKGGDELAEKRKMSKSESEKEDGKEKEAGGAGGSKEKGDKELVAKEVVGKGKEMYSGNDELSLTRNEKEDKAVAAAKENKEDMDEGEKGGESKDEGLDGKEVAAGETKEEREEERTQDKGDGKEVVAGKTMDEGKAGMTQDMGHGDGKEATAAGKTKEGREAAAGKRKDDMKGKEVLLMSQGKGQDRDEGEVQGMETAAEGTMKETELPEREGEEELAGLEMEIHLTEHLSDGHVPSEPVDLKCNFGWWLNKRDDVAELADKLEK